jgi:hypothetical protein
VEKNIKLNVVNKVPNKVLNKILEFTNDMEKGIEKAKRTKKVKVGNEQTKLTKGKKVKLYKIKTFI